jgi:hypothetical protein
VQRKLWLLIENVNLELNRLEGDLKRTFASFPDRVSSFLAASRPSRSAPHDEPAPAPASK